MQQVQGISRLQTVPSEPATAARRKLWILNSWRDLVLYVGTPLLLIPAFALAQAKWSPQDIYLFVAAFGAMGHHLPGMIRAYGDRALFERFKWRFIFAPLFLMATCVAFFWWDLKGILLVVFFWGVWHGLMQTYGFCRIYDAKTGTFDALTRRLDFAMCLVWFGTAVALSPYRLSDTLDTYYMCGGPFIPPSVIQLGQNLILGAAIFVSVLFAAHFIRAWIAGNGPNPVKLGLLVTSITFWWTEQSCLKHSRRHRAVRSLSRHAMLVARLDLQSQSRREGQQHWRVHAIRVPKERLARWPLCRPRLRVRLGLLHQRAYRNGDRQTHSHRRSDRFDLAAFLLRWIYLESSGAFDPSIARTSRWNRRYIARRYGSQLGVARLEMGRRIRRATRRIVVLANASRRSRRATDGVGGRGCA